MEKKDFYVEIRCKCCNKSTKKMWAGSSDDKSFEVSKVITNLYTEICTRCESCTVWEVISYLGIDANSKKKRKMKSIYIILAFTSIVLAAFLIYPEIIIIENSILLYFFRIIVALILLYVSHFFLRKSKIEF